MNEAIDSKVNLGSDNIDVTIKYHPALQEVHIYRDNSGGELCSPNDNVNPIVNRKKGKFLLQQQNSEEFFDTIIKDISPENSMCIKFIGTTYDCEDLKRMIDYYNNLSKTYTLSLNEFVELKDMDIVCNDAENFFNKEEETQNIKIQQSSELVDQIKQIKHILKRSLDVSLTFKLNNKDADYTGKLKTIDDKFWITDTDYVPVDLNDKKPVVVLIKGNVNGYNFVCNASLQYDPTIKAYKNTFDFKYAFKIFDFRFNENDNKPCYSEVVIKIHRSQDVFCDDYQNEFIFNSETVGLEVSNLYLHFKLKNNNRKNLEWWFGVISFFERFITFTNGLASPLLEIYGINKEVSPILNLVKHTETPSGFCLPIIESRSTKFSTYFNLFLKQYANNVNSLFQIFPEFLFISDSVYQSNCGIIMPLLENFCDMKFGNDKSDFDEKDLSTLKELIDSAQISNNTKQRAKSILGDLLPKKSLRNKSKELLDFIGNDFFNEFGIDKISWKSTFDDERNTVFHGSQSNNETDNISTFIYETKFILYFAAIISCGLTLDDVKDKLKFSSMYQAIEQFSNAKQIELL
ncbi:MAG: hypothetical protein LBM13_03695 [Candidatus Ancillula sp.]|jgi:hypothetical protein|nr:hypothetical protein [Candidatus Ancillula sp.]